MSISSNGRRIEDPARLKQFLSITRELEWTPEKRAASLDTLFEAVNSLAMAEIVYYYQRRKSLAKVSVVTRVGAWIFGTAGLLVPLLDVALGSQSPSVSDWGYLLLGIAASLLTANLLFGGSAGHTRSVAAQMALERLVTLFCIDWYAARAAMGPNPSSEDVASSFEILSNFASGLYQQLDRETSEWTADLKEALARYEKQIRAEAA